jgi:hypothetical protein
MRNLYSNHEEDIPRQCGYGAYNCRHGQCAFWRFALSRHTEGATAYEHELGYCGATSVPDDVEMLRHKIRMRDARDAWHELCQAPAWLRLIRWAKIVDWFRGK